MAGRACIYIQPWLCRVANSLSTLMQFALRGGKLMKQKWNVKQLSKHLFHQAGKFCVLFMSQNNACLQSQQNEVGVFWLYWADIFNNIFFYPFGASLLQSGCHRKRLALIFLCCSHLFLSALIFSILSSALQLSTFSCQMFFKISSCPFLFFSFYWPNEHPNVRNCRLLWAWKRDIKTDLRDGLKP